MHDYGVLYRKWTADLEETMEELKSHLETACQDYFPSIKEKAIQVRIELDDFHKLAIFN